MVRRLVFPLVPSILAIAAVLFCVALWGGAETTRGAEGGYGGLLSWTALAVAAGAFFCEYVDATLGMGYGTTLTPVLLLFGFGPLEVVPAVLFSELFTGIAAGISHHNAGNVSLRPGTRHFKISMVLAACSVLGTVAAVLIAVSIPKAYLKLYIGLLVLSMGLVILVFHNHRRRFSWRKIVGLGVLASFNKGMSGGGYGPVVTSGQILSGVEGRSAVGITSFAEGLTCAVGVTVYCLTTGALPWTLCAPLAIGALLSVPLSAWSVKRISTARFTLAIGVITTLLGIVTLARVFL